MEYIQANQGLIMTFLTFIYVISTIVIVLCNAATIKEMKLARMNESRPYIIGQFISVSDYSQSLDFQLKNIGRTIGILNSIEIFPELPISHHKDGLSVFKDFPLAPGQTINVMLEGDPRDILDKEFKISFKYNSCDPKKTTYEEKYIIPLRGYSLSGHHYITAGGDHSPEERSANALRNVASILSSISGRI